MNIAARKRRKKSIRAKVIGTSRKPRLNVFRSNKHISAALIDDRNGKTLIWVGERNLKGTKSEKAFLVGQMIAEKATKKGLKEIIFDRAGYLYHGRVKRLADGAKDKGLKF